MVDILPDNPILWRMLSARRRPRLLVATLVPPLLGAGLFIAGMGLSTFRDAPHFHHPSPIGSFLTAWAQDPPGFALPLFAALFCLQCVLMPFLVLPDPLSQARRDNTIEQWILAGLSPETWLTGHLLAVSLEMLVTTLLYAPLFAVCLTYGTLAADSVLPVILIGVLGGITARLMTLSLTALPAGGLLFAGFAAAGILLPAYPNLPFPAYLPALSPLPWFLDLLPSFASPRVPHPFLSPHLLENLSIAWRDPATWMRLWDLFRSYLLVWSLVLPGIVCGGLRAYRRRGSPFPSPPGTKRAAAGPRLDGAWLTRLFRANGRTEHLGLWEALHLLAISSVVAVLGAVGINPGLDYFPIGWQSWALGALVIVLTVLIGFEACVPPPCPPAHRGDSELFPVLLLVVLQTNALMWLVHALEAFFVPPRFPVNLGFPPLVFSGLLLALLSVALWQSMPGKKWGSAAVLAAAFAWIVLTGAVLASGIFWAPWGPGLATLAVAGGAAIGLFRQSHPVPDA